MSGLGKNRPLVVLSVSGKKGSGKNAFAEAAGAFLTSHGCAVQYLAFADVLKRNTDDIFSTIGGLHRVGKNRDTIISEVIEQQGFLPHSDLREKVGRIVDITVEEIDAGVQPQAYVRTPASWTTQSIVGTEIRRTEDPDYWVKKTTERIWRNNHSGISTVVTDTRFPNELAGAEAYGAVTVRVHVDEDVQIQRLTGRDGHAPSRELLKVGSEISLDDYPFAHVFNNNESRDLIAPVAAYLDGIISF